MYLLISFVLMWFLDSYLPVYVYLQSPWTYLGILPVVAGVAIAMVAVGRFKRAQTGIVPFDEATTLVTKGLYQYTRNPMYLGMFMILSGLAFMLGSISPLLPLGLFMLVIRYNFVAGEERFLEDAFGQDYLDFKTKVRRWL